MLIAGDIGGTKTDLAVFSSDAGPRVPLAQAQFRSADYPSLQAMVSAFLGRITLEVTAGSFAVAGPVVAGHVKTTNLPWIMDEPSIARDLRLKRVRLLNDLEAVARAVPILEPADYETLNEGNAVPQGAIAIIAPGTGLGESFLTWNGARYVAHSSEGGHSDFAPSNERQARLLLYLLKRLDHVGVERVCSGIGVPNVYEFLRDEEQIREAADIAKAISEAPDRTKAILNGQSELCRATGDTVAAILASEAGNLVLKVLATGGVYIAGGVALSLLNQLRAPSFAQTFKNKGRFSALMENIPMRVITARAALIGAAHFGLEQS